jgi:hypothetical protein
MKFRNEDFDDIVIFEKYVQTELIREIKEYANMYLLKQPKSIPIIMKLIIISI